ncbi:MAG: UDP-3-O-acyl-N-acetylglucosamine deacetylase [Thainema sp.]
MLNNTASPQPQAQTSVQGEMQAAFAQSWQCEIATPVEQSGIGLHSGQHSSVRILPAAADEGRWFVRTDLPGSPKIPARVDAVHQTLLSTELAVGDASVRTVEHLLAALMGLGIDNACIEINGPELPLLDGSAQEWVRAIASVGLQTQSAPRRVVTLTEPIWVRQGDAFVMGMPAAEPRFTYGIDFELSAIGNQWHSWSPSPVIADQNLSQLEFATDIAPARTFGLAHQIEQLQANGLIKGGSLENALVCGENGWINPPLRFSNEPARHKLLDLVGDLSLLADWPCMHIVAYKASHQLHVQFVQAVRSQLAMVSG